jgi:hypothetical protein
VNQVALLNSQLRSVGELWASVKVAKEISRSCQQGTHMCPCLMHVRRVTNWTSMGHVITPPVIEVSSFSGAQQNKCVLPFTWRRKQIQFPKRCGVQFRISDDGQGTESQWPSVSCIAVRTLQILLVIIVGRSRVRCPMRWIFKFT